MLLAQRLVNPTLSYKKMLSLSPMCDGFSLAQPHFLGHFGILKAEAEHCVCVLFSVLKY